MRFLLGIFLVATFGIVIPGGAGGDEPANRSKNPKQPRLDRGLTGRLTVRSRRGRPASHPLQLDGEPRFYVEGGTLASATWELEELGDQSQWPSGIHVVLHCKVARIPYQSLHSVRYFRGTLQLANSAKGITSDPLVFAVPAVGSPVVSVTIPDAIRFRDRGRVRQGSVFTDLVAEGRLYVTLKCLDRGVYFAVQEQDFTAHDDEVALVTADADAPASESAGHETEDPFAAAIQACHAVWQDYEASIHTVKLADGKEAKIVLFAREMELKDELESKLTGLLRQLDSTSRDSRIMRQRATLHWLLNQDEAAGKIVAELAEGDNQMKSLTLLRQGKLAMDEARVDDAVKSLVEALKLDHNNREALSRLSLLVTNVSDHVELPKRDEPLEPRLIIRTLPWLTVAPIEPAIDKLNRVTGER